MTATTMWTAWSCSVHLCVGEPHALGEARRVVEAELAAMDAAASRFRPDSELSRVNAEPGRPHPVSPLLHEAVAVALAAARATDGLVDPTLGHQLVAHGYDRDITAVRRHTTRAPVPRRDRSWRDVVLDGSLLTVPAGLALDLGATAKALTADRAAHRAAARTGVPVLLAIGGDLAVAGDREPWTVLVTERPGDDRGQRITTYDGGLATSTILARRWVADGAPRHHLLDPRTGFPVDGPWRTATVAAGSCVAANTASTAALVLGAAAGPWLLARRLPARLVDRDGGVRAFAGWPAETAA
jgi:thiamine biosynthesis lipoprotein